MVGEVFHRVASNYDLMNDVMSAGVHRCPAISLPRILLEFVESRFYAHICFLFICFLLIKFRYWKDRFVTTLNPLPGTRILDVAGGTGDIAFRCLDRMKSTSTFFSKGAPGTPTLPPATLLPHAVRVP
jgi:2-methoxy-6-polyprenyl-1,4-benzoquinol methylase